MIVGVITPTTKLIVTYNLKLLHNYAEMNTRHHANHALSRISETKHDPTYTSGHFVSQLAIP